MRLSESELALPHRNTVVTGKLPNNSKLPFPPKTKITALFKLLGCCEE